MKQNYKDASWRRWADKRKGGVMNRFTCSNQVVLRAVWFLTASTFSLPIAAGDLIVWDSFLSSDYSDGAALTGSGGGGGWAQPWINASDLIFNATGSLSLANHAASGGAAETNGSGGGGERKMDVSGSTAATVYFGALLKFDSIGGTGSVLQVLGEGPRREFRIGTSGASTPKWSLMAHDSSGSATTQVTSVDVTTDTTLLVTRIDYDFSGSLDRLQLFINPLGINEPANSDAEITTEDLGNSLATTEFFRAMFTAGTSGSVDEIRFADTFQEAASATAVPEPSSFLVMTIVLVLACAWQYRRRCLGIC